jgi:hypothetical protein
VSSTRAALHRRPRAPLWLLLALAGVAVGLLPWTAYLSQTLPARHVTHHWDVLWPGFDLFEALALGGTAVAVARSSAWLSPVAAVAGTALLSDAWFDAVTARGGELRLALLMLLVEVPLAAACYWLAFSAAEPASEAGLPPTATPDRLGRSRAAPRRADSAAPSEGRTSR